MRSKIEMLHVTEKRFAEFGFDGTPIRDIVKIANINIPMISYHCSSKVKLLEALVLYPIASMQLELENLFLEDPALVQNNDCFTLSLPPKNASEIGVKITQNNYPSSIASSGVCRFKRFEVPNAF